MTLLMTAGEFDLSVGSVFGFSAVLMWTLFNTGALPLELAFSSRCWRRADRLRQRLVRDQAADPLVPGHAGHAGRARHRAVHHRRLSQRPGTRKQPLRNLVGDFRVPSQVYMSLFWFARGRLLLGYVLTQTKAGNWIQASGGNPNAARARGVNVERTKIALFMLTSVMAALAGIISSIRTSAANPNSGTGRARGDRHGGDRRHGADGRRGTIIGTVLACSSCGSCATASC